MKLRQLSVTMLLFACALLLVSCAQGQAHVTIHRNGTADLDMGIAMSEKTLAAIGKPDLMDNLADTLRKYDLRVEAGEEEGKATLQASRTFDLKDMEDRPLELPEGLTVERTTKKHFFYTRYDVAVTMDMNRLMAGGNGEWSRVVGSLPTLAKKLLQSQLDFDFLLTMPLKPGANNADDIQDGGRTQRWHLDLFGTNRFETSFRVPDIRHIAYAAGAALVVLAAAVWFAVRSIRKRRRRGKGRPD